MTNGLVVVLEDGAVVIKIVTGCDGREVEKVADVIRALGKVPTINEAYEIASKQFTNKEVLVVLSTETVKYKGDGVLSPLYRSTFNQPAFNPRLENGEYEQLAVVNFFTY